MNLNLYGVIILAALVLDWGLNLLADRLNLRALRDELPAGFEDVYAPEAYRKSQRYSRDRTRFSHLTSTVELAPDSASARSSPGCCSSAPWRSPRSWSTCRSRSTPPS